MTSCSNISQSCLKTEGMKSTLNATWKRMSGVKIWVDAFRWRGHGPAKPSEETQSKHNALFILQLVLLYSSNNIKNTNWHRSQYEGSGFVFALTVRGVISSNTSEQNRSQDELGGFSKHTHTQNVAASFYCTHSSPGAQAKRSNASFSMFGLIVKTLVCKNNNNYVTKSLVWNNQLNISSLCMKPMY